MKYIFDEHLVNLDAPIKSCLQKLNKLAVKNKQKRNWFKDFISGVF